MKKTKYILLFATLLATIIGGISILSELAYYITDLQVEGQIFDNK